MPEEPRRLIGTVEYVLREDGAEDTTFQRFQEAIIAGFGRSAFAGYLWEGWRRQEEPNVWYLLPDRRYSIEVRRVA